MAGLTPTTYLSQYYMIDMRAGTKSYKDLFHELSEMPCGTAQDHKRLVERIMSAMDQQGSNVHE
jgi:hypothetical protein